MVKHYKLNKPGSSYGARTGGGVPWAAASRESKGESGEVNGRE